MNDDTNIVEEPPMATEKPKRKSKPRKAKAKKTAKKAKAPAKKAKTKGKSAASAENGLPKPLPVTRWTVPDDKKLTVLIDHNPKSPKSPSAMRFELYRKAETVGDYRKFMRLGRAGGKAHFANLDLARDKARGYIKF